MRSGRGLVAGISDSLGRALTGIKQVHPIVLNTFDDNQAKLAEWESARHIERSPKKKAASPGVAPPAHS